jgi:hypothetical protein
MSKFIESYNAIINEDPDDLFQKMNAVPFIIWNTEREFMQDSKLIDDEALEKYMQFKKDNKIKFPLTIHALRGKAYCNNKVVKDARVIGDYHAALFYALKNKYLEVFPYADSGDDQITEYGTAAGRIDNALNATFISFWTEPVDDKIVKNIIKSTDKVIKWNTKKLAYEQPPKGTGHVRRHYTDKGTISIYKKGIEKFTSGGERDIIDVVRDRLFGTNIYVGESLEKKYFNKFIKAGGNLSGAEYSDKYPSYSAWYIPKKDQVISFYFAGHTYFMGNNFPRRNSPEKPFVTSDFVNKGLISVLKPYQKPVQKIIEKENDVACRYAFLYMLGWIRFNISTVFATVTYMDQYAKQKDVNKIIQFLKESYPSLKTIEVENRSKGSSIKYNVEDIDLSTNPKGDPIDVVRNRMFGNLQYSGETFEKVYDILCEILKGD